MAELSEIVKKAVSWYAAEGFNTKTFALMNEENQVYAVAAIDYPVHRQPAGLVVMARLEDQRVIIEFDNTDRPLVDALMRAGIPREQIILAYAGETLPESVEA
ncbi:MAG: XisI protein [Anaerolineae bacterium]|nr:XisI protein [Anaerolineae bacterium]